MTLVHTILAFESSLTATSIFLIDKSSLTATSIFLIDENSTNSRVLIGMCKVSMLSELVFRALLGAPGFCKTVFSEDVGWMLQGLQ